MCIRDRGRDFDLILECHRSMDPCEAIAFAKGVEVYRPLFLEDPIPPDSPEAMADVAKGTSIPVATGERFINIQEFETILQKRAARYLRPDVCALGGLTPSKMCIRDRGGDTHRGPGHLYGGHVPLYPAGA